MALGLGALVALAIAAAAMAKFDVFRAGNSILEIDVQVTPKALPKDEFAPAALRVRGEISTADKSHPPALREATIDFDGNSRVNTWGLPICRAGGRDVRRDPNAARKICRSSIVGSGTGKIEVDFPDLPAIDVNAPITVFNGGTVGGVTTLFVHAAIPVPVPTEVVTVATIRKVDAGRYGLRTVSKIPVIAGGSGSVVSFDIRLGRTYTRDGRKVSVVTAKCPDGYLDARIKEAIFVDESSGARGALRGTITRPCTPKG